MLDMGFIPDIETICSKLPANRQTLLFSGDHAAADQEAGRQVPDQSQIYRGCAPRDLEPQHRPAQGGGRRSRNKRDVLRQLLRTDNVTTAIVFCNRKTTVRELAKSLNAERLFRRRNPWRHGSARAGSPSLTGSRRGRSTSCALATSRRAGSISRASATCSTSTRPGTRTITSTASAAPAAPARPARLHFRRAGRRRSDRQCREADRTGRSRSTNWRARRGEERPARTQSRAPAAQAHDERPRGSASPARPALRAKNGAPREERAPRAREERAERAPNARPPAKREDAHAPRGEPAPLPAPKARARSGRSRGEQGWNGPVPGFLGVSLRGLSSDSRNYTLTTTAARRFGVTIRASTCVTSPRTGRERMQFYYGWWIVAISSWR